MCGGGFRARSGERRSSTHRAGAEARALAARSVQGPWSLGSLTPGAGGVGRRNRSPTPLRPVGWTKSTAAGRASKPSPDERILDKRRRAHGGSACLRARRTGLDVAQSAQEQALARGAWLWGRSSSRPSRALLRLRQRAPGYRLRRRQAASGLGTPSGCWRQRMPAHWCRGPADPAGRGVCARLGLQMLCGPALRLGDSVETEAL